MTLSQKSTVRRLSIFGLSESQSIQIVNEINRLLYNNGPEWTISRLKLLKTAFIQMIAGQEPEWTWIKTRAGIPAGPFRAIFNLKKPHRVLNALMVYSSLISPNLTDKQWNKFSKSVRKVRENPINIFADIFEPILHDRKWVVPLTDARLSRMLLSTQRTPSIEGFRTQVNNVRHSVRSANHMTARNYIIRYLKPKGYLPDWFLDTLSKNWSSVASIHDGLDSKDIVGRISFLQEPGYKLRAIANPLPIFQILLDPLKQSLLEILRVIPNDFTHDQDAGVSYIQDLLKRGVKLSSVDLSDATNNLPLSDQIALLRSIFDKEVHYIIDLFEEVSKSQWAIDAPDGTKTITWGTGQPLGLGPSFPSFALYHHFIMRYVISLDVGNYEPLYDLIHCIIKGTSPGNYEYAIVGDDICMNSCYTDTYLSVMSKLECPVSIDKCLFDAYTAEFCSRIITVTKVFRAYKWKSVSDSSFIALCKSFGPRILPLLRPKQRAIAERIGEIPYTLGGPIGWNPNGKCLQQREAELWRLAEVLLDMSDDTDVSVPQAEIHYQLKRELGMINFSQPTLIDICDGNLPEASCEEDTRQSFVRELLYQLDMGASKKMAFNIANEMWNPSNYTSYTMNDIERKFHNFTFPVDAREDALKEDMYIKKLYALLFTDG